MAAKHVRVCVCVLLKISHCHLTSGRVHLMTNHWKPMSMSQFYNLNRPSCKSNEPETSTTVHTYHRCCWRRRPSCVPAAAALPQSLAPSLPVLHLHGAADHAATAPPGSSYTWNNWQTQSTSITTHTHTHLYTLHTCTHLYTPIHTHTHLHTHIQQFYDHFSGLPELASCL